ncbi:sigma-70 family RNA polymerase sigma factor [Pelagicoccus mobilis]|uniref:Sigma-70 family RNA polymerase sigma factor n=1 Tax=Pelagicoccus mobilis TaxID=415221 RepID=A0A934VJ49_9BACT|nr:sigma-70 family RNA polymerase sigma factor [Pelagicoccus mobilis]MBK1875226.1 sigma-70 family RNA polymerase sigma factor [Pelagicoccus mobilis]
MPLPEHENQPTDAGDLAMEITSIQPRLYGFILKRIADRELTLEVLQRTNLVLCRKANEFQKGSSFTAWAFTVAKFQIMAWRKDQGRNRLVFTEDVHELLDRTTASEIESVDRRIPILKSCINKLRDEDRELIQQRYRDGESVETLAQRLKKSIDAMGMRLLRIRKRLRDCVQINLKQEARHEH